jgi:hypothetical protein
VTLQFYRCSWKANEPRAIGCPALRWVNSSDLASHQFPEADIKLVELLKSRPEFWT